MAAETDPFDCECESCTIPPDECPRKKAEAELARVKTTTWCAYCGQEYSLDRVTADQIGEHIKTCPKHPLRAAEAEIKRVRDLINLDRTGLAAALDEVRGILTSYGWLAEDGVWGSYDYTQQTISTLRKEIGWMMDAAKEAIVKGLRESGRRAHSAFHPEEGTFCLICEETPVPSREACEAVATALRLQAMKRRGKCCEACDEEADRFILVTTYLRSLHAKLASARTCDPDAAMDAIVRMTGVRVLEVPATVPAPKPKCVRCGGTRRVMCSYNQGEQACGGLSACEMRGHGADDDCMVPCPDCGTKGG